MQTAAVTIQSIDDVADMRAPGHQARGQRKLVSVVMREVYSDHLVRARRQPHDFGPGLIGRTVIDEDQFIVVAHALHARVV